MSMSQHEVVTRRSRKAGESPRDGGSRTESPRPSSRPNTPQGKGSRDHTPQGKGSRDHTPQGKGSREHTPQGKGSREHNTRLKTRRSLGGNAPKESAAEIFRATSVDKNAAPPPKKRPSLDDSDDCVTTPPLKRRRAMKNGTPTNQSPPEDPVYHSIEQDIDMESDCYCWICHKEGSLMTGCELCPRVYHVRCLSNERQPGADWMCPECEKIMRAECTDTRSRAMTMLTLDQLCTLLRFSLQRMRHVGSEPFQKPVDPESVPNYSDYVVHPMDLEMLEKNIKKKMYGCTDAFLADAKWLLHNCIVYNGTHHKLTTAAKMIVKICKHEMNEIEICPDCYSNSQCKGNPDWFCIPCRYPHPLVWAKLKGYPFWPAKALRKADNQVDVRFFGAHDRSWIPVAQIFLLSKDIPVPVKIKKGGLENAINETDKHIKMLRRAFHNLGPLIEKQRSPNFVLEHLDMRSVSPDDLVTCCRSTRGRLREKFGHFEYAPFRTPYDRNDMYCHNRLKSGEELEKAKVRKRTKRTNISDNYGTGFEDSRSGPSVDPLYRKPRRLPKFSPEGPGARGAKTVSMSSKTATALKTKYNSIVSTKRTAGPKGAKKMKASSGSLMIKSETLVKEVNSVAETLKIAQTDPEANFFNHLKLKKEDEKAAEHESSVELSNGSEVTKIKEIERLCDQMVLKIPRLDLTQAVKEEESSSSQADTSMESVEEDEKEMKADKEKPEKRVEHPPPFVVSSTPQKDSKTKPAEAAASPIEPPKQTSTTEPGPKEPLPQSSEVKPKDEQSETVDMETEKCSETPDTAIEQEEHLSPEHSDLPLSEDSDNSIEKGEEKTSDSVEKVVPESSDKPETPQVEKEMVSVVAEEKTVNTTEPDRSASTSSSGNALEVTPMKRSVLREQLQKTIETCKKNLGISGEEDLPGAETDSADEDALMKPLETSSTSESPTKADDKSTCVSTPDEKTTSTTSSTDSQEQTSEHQDADAKATATPGDKDGNTSMEIEGQEECCMAEKMDTEELKIGGDDLEKAGEVLECSGVEKMNVEASANHEKRSKDPTESVKTHDEHLSTDSENRRSQTPPLTAKRKTGRTLSDSTDKRDSALRDILAEVEQLTSARTVRTVETVVPPLLKLTDVTGKAKSGEGEDSIAKENSCGNEQESRRSVTPPGGKRRTPTPSMPREVSDETGDSSDGEKLVIDFRDDQTKIAEQKTEEVTKAARRVTQRTSSASSRSSEPMDVTRIDFILSPPPPPHPTIPLPQSLPTTPQSSRSAFNFGKYTDKMLQSIQGTFQELYQDIMSHEESMVAAKKYQQELDQLKWTHRQHLIELKHNFELAMKEVVVNLTQEKNKAVMDIKKACEANAKKEIEETKKKQWCAQCGKEAIFYCCWNTSYCDFPCQQNHWPEHMGHCTQAQTGPNANSTANNANAPQPPTTEAATAESKTVADAPVPTQIPPQVTQVIQPGHVSVAPSTQPVMFLPVSATHVTNTIPSAPPLHPPPPPQPPQVSRMITASAGATCMPHIQMPNMHIPPPIQQQLPGPIMLQQQRPLQVNQLQHSIIGQPPTATFGNRMIPPAPPLPQHPQQQMPVYLLGGLGIRQTNVVPQFPQRPY